MRIVSLLPSATEIACYLGLRDQLVGISHECDFPADVTGLPVLTASILATGLTPKQIDTAVHEARLEGSPIYSVDGARLNALGAQLIVTQGVCSVCAVTPATIDAGLQLVPLRSGDGSQLLSLSATTFQGVLRDIRSLAQAAGVESRGAERADRLQARWDAIAAGGPAVTKTGAAADAAAPSVFFMEWPDPPWHAGHWVPEQIEAAGGRDIFGVAGGASTPLPWEQVAAADPDWLIAGACGYNLEQNLKHARALLDHPIAGSLRAVQQGRFWAVDANGYFSRPAPRLVDGAALLRGILEGRGDTLDGRRAARV